jgi:hypothetical protein
MAPLNNFTNNQFDRPVYPESIFSKFLPKKSFSTGECHDRTTAI